jgi:RNA polymerase sporulation-specific sigma factor
MNYKDLNDNELLSYINDSNEDANEIIFKKYAPLINKTAKRMSTYCKYAGLELNDLIQEGMLGLNQAINTYSDHKQATFYTYAKTLIERKMITMVVGHNRLKHRFLNNSISLELPDDDGELVSLEFLLKDNKANPEQELISNEYASELISNIKEALTELELQVFELRLNNFNYREISDILEKDPKTIDNALQRIKNKTKKIIAKDKV